MMMIINNSNDDSNNNAGGKGEPNKAKAGSEPSVSGKGISVCLNLFVCIYILSLSL